MLHNYKNDLHDSHLSLLVYDAFKDDEDYALRAKNLIRDAHSNHAQDDGGHCCHVYEHYEL